MNYSKPMIDLVREIRKRVPNDAKPGIKLANPELLDELIDIYRVTSDNVLKALTRELLNMAGGDWNEKLTANVAVESNVHSTKIYRGQVRLEQKAAVGASDNMASEQHNSRPKRMYRGQVVAEY